MINISQNIRRYESQKKEIKKWVFLHWLFFPIFILWFFYIFVIELFLRYFYLLIKLLKQLLHKITSYVIWTLWWKVNEIVVSLHRHSLVCNWIIKHKHLFILNILLIFFLLYHKFYYIFFLYFYLSILS